MSEAHKRDEKVEICVEVGDRPADTGGCSADGGADGSGGRGGGSGKKGKGRYQPNGRGQGWAKIKIKRGMVGWLREHYADMKNEELCKVLGVSLNVLHRYARQYRLKKSEEFMQMCTQLGWRAAKAKGEATGYAANREGARRYHAYCKANGIPHCGFKKGVKNVERWGAERWKQIIAKTHQTRRKTLARDHRRVELGLEPLTGLVKSVRMSREEVCLRNYMKTRYGYIVKPHDAVIRYDDNTRRWGPVEEHAKSLGVVVIHVKAKLTDEAIR